MRLPPFLTAFCLSLPIAAQSLPPSNVYQPMTQEQRFEEYARATFNPLMVLRASVSSAVNHGLDNPREWGQGGAGYGRRVAHNVGSTVLRNTMQYGLSVAFAEDNRYFAAPYDDFWRRTRHVLESPFVARDSLGNRTFSASSVGSAFGSAVVSRTWTPPSWDDPRDIFVSFGLTLGFQAGFNFVKEFAPRLVGQDPPPRLPASTPAGQNSGTTRPPPQRR